MLPSALKSLLIILLVGSGLAACKKELVPGKTAATIGQPFDLPNQQATTLPIGSTPISITLKAVNDSRCPVGVQCIVAGYATVDVELADASSIQTARLSLHAKNVPNYPADSTMVTLNQRPYSLQLLDVTPYPGAENGNPTKVAKLRLLAR